MRRSRVGSFRSAGAVSNEFERESPRSRGVAANAPRAGSIAREQLLAAFSAAFCSRARQKEPPRLLVSYRPLARFPKREPWSRAPGCYPPNVPGLGRKIRASNRNTRPILKVTPQTPITTEPPQPATAPPPRACARSRDTGARLRRPSVTSDALELLAAPREAIPRRHRSARHGRGRRRGTVRRRRPATEQAPQVRASRAPRARGAACAARVRSASESAAAAAAPRRRRARCAAPHFAPRR